MRFHGYPAMYYSRGGVDDLKFVQSRMKCIPEDLKLEVSKKYESFGPVHGGKKRKAANIWLDQEARKYRDAPNVKDVVKDRVDSECNTPKSTAKEFKTKVDAITPVKRKSFLDGLLDDVDKKHRK